MRKVKAQGILDGSHALMNDVVISTASYLGDAEIVFKIDDLIKERGITQKDLANMTGMRVGTVSELVNGKGISINKVQLLSIMVALRVTDLSEIIEIRVPTEIKEQYEAEAKEWKETREMPMTVKEMYRKNVLASNQL
ncbi:helix-turn-helix domain-containing protein [Heyndrickxia ginsengihumi]|uniref:helix-turn-helix domain-containing protein n=1 Tax=Heyndrickxia ginsengihumi TaxID=363870 RepID=UPI003D23F836